MTITFIKTTPSSTSNIWNSRAQTIILNTNAEGKMNGIGKALLNYDMEVAAQYQLLCARGNVELGTPVLIHSTKHRNKQFVLFPIKAKSGDAPRMDALESCFRLLCQNGPTWGITSIATHKLGCGSSDVYLSWEHVVYPMMQYYLGNAPVLVTIYGASAPVVPPTPEPEVEQPTQVTPVITIDVDMHEEEWIIYHATNRSWSVMYAVGMATNDDDPHYVPAGQVWTSSVSREQCLEALFDLSQNKDMPWHELECVIPGRSNRSTMVGDIFQHMQSGQSYRVEGNGFSLLSKPVYA